MSGIRPWDGGSICLELHTQEHALEDGNCHQSETKDKCCKPPTDSEETPTKEDPCSDGCHCFCCVSIILPALETPLFNYPQKKPQLRGWEISPNTHDFAHLIWHPPQIG